MDDVVINKCAVIERCLKRVREEYTVDFRTNFSRQDALILNLERACQAAIDLASHLVRRKKLGIPQQTRDVFDYLKDAGMISEELSLSMKNMVGFRNIAVHDYTAINLEVVESIVQHNLKDLEEFAACLLKHG
jgi:uncharacterized protein YutE (UPF0331/DUF86 family)